MNMTGGNMDWDNFFRDALKSKPNVKPAQEDRRDLYINELRSALMYAELRNQILENKLHKLIAYSNFQTQRVMELLGV